jgi:hypothetical protein
MKKVEILCSNISNCFDVIIANAKNATLTGNLKIFMILFLTFAPLLLRSEREGKIQ